MPQTKFQDVVYTIIMVCIMVYAMVCYNVAIDMGGLSNEVFLIALHELPIMGTIGFILEFFIVGNLAKILAFRFVDPAKGLSHSAGFRYRFGGYRLSLQIQRACTCRMRRRYQQ